MYRKTWIAAFAVLVAGYAFAADTAAPSDGLERPSALDTSSYTAIPRVVYNSGGASSYLRFANVSGAAASFEVKVTGGETGTDYTGAKTYQLTVPDKASLQKSIDEIRTGLTAQGGPDIALKTGDTFLNLYVTSDKKGSGVGFQHLTFNGNTGFFENVSLCTFDPTMDYSGVARNLVNVHTSKLAGYPSKVEIHNPDAASRVVRGKVYDAVTGTSLGSFTSTVPANGTTVMDESAIEQQISFQPSASQLHINIQFETADSSAYTAVVGHKVTQTSSGAVFNLTQICAVNPVRPTTTTDCTSTGGTTTTNPSAAKTADTSTGCCPTSPTTPTTPSGAKTSALALDTTTNPSGSTGGGSTSCGGSSDTFKANADALSQTFNVGEQATIALSTLTANDSKATGATLDSVTAFVDFGTSTANGTYASTASGITYTPARAGNVSFTYRLKSSSGELSNSATVSLTVTNPATALKANNDTLTQVFNIGAPVQIPISSLIANDTNTTNATVIESVTAFVDSSGVANGTYTQLASVISYSPARSGTVTFTYRLSPGGGGALSNFATVTLTVGDPNLPRPANDTLTQGFGPGALTAISLATLTANDANASGATLDSVTPFVDAGTTTANGTYILATNGINYTPARAGTVTFTYRLKNGSGVSEPATVTLTVSPGASAAPTATNKTISFIIPAGFINAVEVTPADVVGAANAVGVEFDQAVPLNFTTTGPAPVATVPLVTKMIIDYGNLAASTPPFTVSFDYRLKNSVGTSATARMTVNVSKAQ